MIVDQGQCFLDMVLQGTGNIENALVMSIVNGISVTDDVVIGADITPAGILNKPIVKLFNANNKPATFEAFLTSNDSNTLDGIGYMVIGETFVVS